MRFRFQEGDPGNRPNGLAANLSDDLKSSNDRKKIRCEPAELARFDAWQRRIILMIIEYAAAAIGAVAIAAILTCFRIQRRIREIDARLAKMQKEIDVLQMQESRRLMVELKASSRAEAPQIHPDSDSEIVHDDVMRLLKTPPTTPA